MYHINDNYFKDINTINIKDEGVFYLVTVNGVSVYSHTLKKECEDFVQKYFKASKSYRA